MKKVTSLSSIAGWQSSFRKYFSTTWMGASALSVTPGYDAALGKGSGTCRFVLAGTGLRASAERGGAVSYGIDRWRESVVG
jgi:hypothetical protein